MIDRGVILAKTGNWKGRMDFLGSFLLSHLLLILQNPRTGWTSAPTKVFVQKYKRQIIKVKNKRERKMFRDRMDIRTKAGGGSI